MSRAYRIGVIGHTGRGNYGHGIDTVWQHLPGCQIVAVADAHEAGRAKAAQRLEAPQAFADYREMLDKAKPEVVSICPRWVDQHRDMVVECAHRGIHMYMEKPMCRTLAEADQMVAACEKNNVKLAIAYVTRYSPTLQMVKSLLDSGQIGELVEIRARGKEDHRGGGEDLWVLGSHLMNMIHYLAGEPHWCFAQVLQDAEPVAARHVAEGNEGLGPLAGDRVDAVFGLADGAKAYFGSARDGGRGRFGMRICGTKGVIDTVTGFLPKTYYLGSSIWWSGRAGVDWVPLSSAGIGKPETGTDPHHAAGNIAACRDLLEAIQEDRQPEASIYEARTSTEMIVSVFESHRQGGPVSLPLDTRHNPLALMKAASNNS